MHSRPLAVSFCLALVAVAHPRGYGAIQYTITRIGTLGGTHSAGMAINNNGQVVGTSEVSNGNEHAFLYTAQSQMIDLGSALSPWTINDDGYIVGGVSNLEQHAAIGTISGPVRDLGTLGGSYSYGYGINSQGQVVGISTTANGEYHVFLTSLDGPMQDLGSLGLYGEPLAINDNGQIAGYGFVDDTHYHAYLISDGVQRDLGTLGGLNSEAWDLNNQGQAIGFSKTAGGATHACLYSGGFITDLGTLGGEISFAYGINEQGQIVGDSMAADGSDRAFLYNHASGMLDLNAMISPSSGWKLYSALDINERGQILVIGGRGGMTRPLVLNPIPEPGTAWLLAMGCIGLIRRRASNR